jgi:histone chaperone ASF1
LDNPAQFHSPFSFEITFECLLPLEEDLEWKVLYVGSAEDTTHDQVLDEILLGPIPVGINKFILQADAPDISQIPNEDILGVTVVLVTCSYREKEFVRVGYYVNNEYDEELYNDDGTTVGGPPPKPLDMNKVRRIVLADKPRVTRFPIQWGDQTEEEAKETPPIVLGTSSSSNDDGIMMGTVSPEEDEGMTLEELGTGKEEEDEFEDDDEDDDVSLEGKDMMGDDHLMMSNASPMTRAME